MASRQMPADDTHVLPVFQTSVKRFSIACRKAMRTVLPFGLFGIFSILFLSVCLAGPQGVPATPTNLTVVGVTYSQVNLTWAEKGSNISGFRIDRMVPGGTFRKLATVGSSPLSFQDTTVQPNTTYSYHVCAFNNNGYSNYSNTVTVTTPATPASPPTAPTGLTATTASTSQINLSWADSANDETGFYVERSPDNVTFTQIAVLGATTSYADTGLSASKTYYYRVRAYNGYGNSGYSNVANATTQTAPPAAPSGLSATASSSSQINLSWTDNANNASGYIVQRSPDNVTFTQVGTVGANGNSYSDSGLSASSTYYYRVYAYNSGGNSGYSNTANATTLPSAPTAPTGLTATTASISQINLSWTDNANNVSGYIVQRSPDNVTFTQIATVGANATSYADIGLTAGTTYYYRVCAYNSGGNSAFSNTANATTQTAPPTAPTGLTATAISSSQINLSWTDSTNDETGFYIERSPDNVTFTQIASLGATTSYADSGLSASTAYYYRVRAYNAGGSSGYSNVANATTQTNTLPAVTLPIEVLGAAGTTQTASVSLPANQASQVAGLWMQVHSLSYADKASVQVNNGSWIALDNNTVQVAEPGKSYGGIGGGFATLKLTLPLAGGTVVAGNNTISFRFNGTDGVSMGFRVLAFNFQDAYGNNLLPAITFTQDDPTTWQPPLSDPTSIAAGQSLWRTATLTHSPLDGTSLQAHCTDCHAQDGRDLKYFNYSNLSIIERAKFHGLSNLQGQQIASFIRTLSVPNPGRPWNPPYQPGPGMDSQPLQNWAAGAGLNSVLDKDSAMLSSLFPNGITASAIATTGTLNMREMPISMQLPDWNHWLPKVHPIDAWGSAFTGSRLYEKYAGPESDPNTFTLPAHLLDPNWDTWPNLGTVFSEMQAWGNDLHNFISNYNQSTAPWSPGYSEQIYSTGRWMLVKTWEMMQEFGLEGYGPSYYGSYGEANTWENGHPFHISPFMLHVPSNTNGIEGSALKTNYLSQAWYQTQLVLNAGNRHQQGSDTIDWQYTYGIMKDLTNLSGAPIGLQMFAFMTKGIQNTDNGIGPDNPSNGWNPYGAGDISLLVNSDFDGLWKQVAPSDRTALLQATLQNWFAKCQQYTPAQYYAGGIADPNYVPTGFYYGLWADRLYYMIPRYRSLGVDGTLLNSICDWAATIWPLGNWAAIKM